MQPRALLHLPFVFLLYLSVSLFLPGCGSNSKAADVSVVQSISLSTELDTIGNSVALPSNAEVSGVVVDVDGNNTADGLDLDGNPADAEVIYISGSLGKALPARETSRGFYFKTNPDLVYYFVVSNNKIVFSEDEAGINTSVQIIVNEDSGEITGIDKDGDGAVSEEEDDSLSGIVIVYVTANPVVALFSSVAANPALPGSTVTFTVSNVDVYLYSVDGGAWSAERSVSQPISFAATPGNHTVRVLGVKDGKSQVAERPTTYIFQAAWFYRITVTNADKNNTAKSVPALPVELWAVTTQYESPGFESEKVRLKLNMNGLYEGILYTIDGDARTLLVFDDVVTAPVIVGGTVNSDIATGGAGSFDRVEADDYFSPCWDLQVDDKGTISYIWDFWSNADNGSLMAPVLPPMFTSDTGFAAPGSLTSNEVFTARVAPAAGSVVEVDYTAFAKGSRSSFCEVNSYFVYGAAFTVYYGSLMQYYHTHPVTDNNFSATGGGVIPRFPYNPPM